MRRNFWYWIDRRAWCAAACLVAIQAPAAAQPYYLDPDAAYGTADAPSGISALSPAQVFSVRPPPSEFQSVPLAPLPPPVIITQEDGSTQLVTPPHADIQDFGPQYDWDYHMAYDLDGNAAVDVVGSPEQTARRFAPVAGLSGMRYAQRGWVYRQAGGPAVSVGSVKSNAPRWGSAANIGGVQLANWSGAANSVMPEGRLGYSSTVGRLDYSDANAKSGGLTYGPSVGGGAVRYGLTSDFTVESQLQRAPDMSVMGVGGIYSAGQWGTVQAGATQGSLQSGAGWRYELGYNVALTDYFKLGYRAIATEEGYGDLAGYTSGPAGSANQRNIVTAGVPLGGGYGTFSGTYNGLRDQGAFTEQRLGVQHSLDLTPRTRFVLGADRDAVSGDYAMRMQLTMPVDILSGSLLR